MIQLTSKFAGLCLALSMAPLFGQGTSPTFKDDFLNQLQDVQGKIVGLAEATPAEKYSWRPAPGVRSVGEVFVHIASANYYYMNLVGVKTPPNTVSRDSEKTVTDKEKVVALLKGSFEHIRSGVSGMSDADMMKAMKMMGKEANYQAALFQLANHMHEHLGQSIAYARTNGVTPPWSKKE